jgi:hypothetical protein
MTHLGPWRLISFRDQFAPIAVRSRVLCCYSLGIAQGTHSAGSHATARVRHASLRHVSCRMAGGGVRAAAEDARGWVPRHQGIWRGPATFDGVPSRLERSRACRGPELGDGIPLRGDSIRQTTTLAADLVRHQVAVIVANGGAAQVAKKRPQRFRSPSW